jgi:acyl-CoA synthetase (AMP-forming)/AMP-acid ligase II
LAGLLFEAEGDPDSVAVTAGEVDRTLGQIRDQAEAIAAALRSAGVEPGHVVAVSLPSGPDVVASLFGVWRAGAVYLPLNPRLTPTETERVTGAVPPAARILPAVGDAADGTGVRVVAEEAGAVERARFDADIALIQFTSGTTGAPKPVLLRHSGVLELIDGVVGKLRGSSTAAPSERAPMPNLVPVSLSLWAGIYNVLFARRVDAPVVILDPFTTTGFAAAVHRFGLRSAVLPPAAMTMLADDDAIDDLTPLRFVRSITAPLSPLQARRFRDKFGVSVLNGYGQTEIGGEIVGWNAADSREFGESKLGAVGRPHAGVTVRAVDAEGRDVEVDQPGELWVKTPAMSAGYADGNDLGDRLSPDGWFRTGDVGRVDADGFVWIEGRVSDMINRGGLKVFPAEVAEVLRLAPEVEDAAVVGVPDDRLGEVPVAFVVVPAGSAIDPAALEARCREHLAPYKVPVRFVALDALPRNEVGKVLTGELVTRAAAAHTAS